MTFTDAQKYHKAKNTLFIVSYISTACFLLIAYKIQSSLVIKLPFLLPLFYAATKIFLFPWSFLSGYYLDKKHALSKQTLVSWFKDYSKKYILSCALFCLTYTFYYWLLANSPSNWWWFLSLTSICVSVLTAIVFPLFLLPIFHKTFLITDPELVLRFERTLKKCGYPRMSFFKLILGDKTRRANAALAGLGKTQRVLISDTLIQNFNPDEIQMVIAHELGHASKRHIFKSCLIDFSFVAAATFLAQAYIPYSFLIDTQNLSLLLLAQHFFYSVCLPIHNYVSRAHEAEADLFALKAYPDIGIFRSLITKLSALNLSNPEPSWFERTFLHSHPYAKKRIEYAEKYVKCLANSISPN